MDSLPPQRWDLHLQRALLTRALRCTITRAKLQALWHEDRVIRWLQSNTREWRATMQQWRTLLVSLAANPPAARSDRQQQQQMSAKVLADVLLQSLVEIQALCKVALPPLLQWTFSSTVHQICASVVTKPNNEPTPLLVRAWQAWVNIAIASPWKMMNMTAWAQEQLRLGLSTCFYTTLPSLRPLLAPVLPRNAPTTSASFHGARAQLALQPSSFPSAEAPTAVVPPHADLVWVACVQGGTADAVPALIAWHHGHNWRVPVYHSLGAHLRPDSLVVVEPGLVALVCGATLHFFTVNADDGFRPTGTLTLPCPITHPLLWVQWVKPHTLAWGIPNDIRDVCKSSGEVPPFAILQLGQWDSATHSLRALPPGTSDALMGIPHVEDAPAVLWRSDTATARVWRGGAALARLQGIRRVLCSDSSVGGTWRVVVERAGSGGERSVLHVITEAGQAQLRVPVDEETTAVLCCSSFVASPQGGEAKRARPEVTSST